jgi:hypothetical protein
MGRPVAGDAAGPAFEVPLGLDPFGSRDAERDDGMRWSRADRT